MEVNKQTFSQEVLGASVPVLVDFWAPWCGPCRMQGPVLEELATELDGKVLVAKVNVDQEPELAMQFQVSSIPTLLLFDQGKVVEQRVGLTPKQALENMITPYL